MEKQPEKQSVGMKLPPQINELWERTANTLGLDKTATFIVAIRRLAQAEGVIDGRQETPAP